MLARAFARFFILTFCLLFAQLSVAEPSAGFAESYKLGSHHLVLNGVGERIKLFVKAYVVALYLPQKNTNAEEILNSDTPIALHMVVTSSQATTERMANALNEGFQNSTGGNTGPIKDRMEKFISALSTKPVKQNDYLEFNYLPGKGTTLVRDGVVQVTIPGTDFRAAFYGIWLSNNPVSAKLKAQLLGTQA